MRELTLRKLGEYCTTQLCKNCEIGKMCRDNHHGCPEGLRVPKIGKKAAELIAKQKIEKWDEEHD